MKEDHVFYSNVHPDEGQKKFVLSGLDGLRALAVLLVLVYHIWPASLPGGMIGVDIFFVISGYLITSLMLREGAETGKINIIAFWKRRLRRLIPAVLVLVSVVGSFALIVGGDVQVGLGRQILGALTYSSNWLYIVAGQDYFAQTSPELMTNFWSLAVEEQFYFFWPILFVFTCMFIARWRQRIYVPAALGIFSILLAAVLSATGAGADRIYYGTDTHLYGLMLGVVLAFMIPWSMYPPSDSRLYPYLGYGEGLAGLMRGALGWLCLLLIFPLAFLMTSKSAWFMPWWLLFASLLALGVIQALFADARSPLSTGLRRLLSLAPLVWIGRRSYGIYLWHWPIMVFAHYLFGYSQQLLTQILVVICTFVVAGLSYMYVEQPVRRLGFRGSLRAWGQALKGPAKVFPAVCSGLLILGIILTGFAVATAPALTQAQEVVAQGQESIKDTPELSSTAPADSEASSGTDPGLSPTPQPRPAADSVTIIGDSVTVAAAAALHESMPQATVDAAVSRSVVQGIPLAEEMAQQGSLGKYVVLALTTNSTMSDTQLEEFIEKISPQAERKIILVTGAAPPNLTWVNDSNAVIYRMAQKYPEKVFVADWAQAAAGHPEYLVSDGVHPQHTGQEIYAQTIKDAVARAEKAS